VRHFNERQIFAEIEGLLGPAPAAAPPPPPAPAEAETHAV